MNMVPSRAASLVVRGCNAGAGIALILWSLSEDVLIGGGPGFGITQAVVFALGTISLVAAVIPLKLSGIFLGCLVTLSLTVLLGEMMLRTLYGPRYAAVFAFHPEYLYRFIAGTEREYRHLPENGGDAFVYRINSDGFRGEELEHGDALRVVVYGDSFIHAEFSRLENTFAERLESRLADATGREIEVVNAGVAGYGPDQVLRKFEDEIGWLHPDLVVVAVYAGNDFGDLLRNRLYRLDDTGALVANDYQLDPAVRRAMELNRSEPVLRKLVREAADRFRGRGPGTARDESAQQRVDRFLVQHQAEYREFIEEGSNRVGDLREDPYSADISLLPEAPSSRFKRRMMGAVLAKVRDVAKENGVPLFGLVIPHPIDVTLGNHASGEVDRARYPNYDPDRLANSVAEIWSGLGVPYVNLLKPFRDAGGADLYLRGGDDHWNDRGQDEAARIVTERLLGLGLPGVAPASDEPGG